MLITDFNYNSFNINTVVHIGANIGEELEFYKNLGTKIVYFFEPRSEALTELYENCKKYSSDMEITVFPCGLGSKNEEKVIHNAGQSSSFLAPKLHLTVHPNIYFNTGKRLSIRRGDLILPEDLVIDMINIDVQGYELEVLKGLGNLLNKVKIVYTEINVDELYESCPNIDKIDSYLYTFGLKRVREAVTPMLWGDAIYIRQ